MSNATRISELTAAVLNAEDPDDILDLLADSTFEILSPDSLLVLLPLNDSTWVCELVRGCYQAELLGASVSHSSPFGSRIRTLTPPQDLPTPKT